MAAFIPHAPPRVNSIDEARLPAYIRQMTREQLGLRLPPELLEKLRAASNAGLYAPSMTEIVERGIILALRELERKRK